MKNGNIQERLNKLLSDYQVYYQNLRAFHWLVKGQRFFQLHKLFESMYTEAAENVDEIAERILTVGGIPLHSFSDYLENANLKPEKNLRKESEIMPVVISNTERLLSSYRVILAEASEIEDEGTVALMSDLIGSTEKQLWMLKSMAE